MKNNLFIIFGLAAFILLNFFSSSCAKVGRPEGGPDDTIPPVVVKTKPPNFSTNIEPKKISITFNEFVVLKNERSEFIVSPFNEEPILPRINNKSIIIDLNKLDMDSSATYTFNFGHSIADNNEGNPFPDYRFVFSPKGYIDSMSLGGTIVDAFTLLPDKKGMAIYLYSNLNDSAPKTVLPNYIARSDEQGNFMFGNIKTGTYRLFALKDADLNYKYNMPDEAIAFLDSTIQLNPIQYYKKYYYWVDTIYSDSVNGELVDTTIFDTVSFNQQMIALVELHDSLLSDSAQAVIDTVIPEKYFVDSVASFFNEFVAGLYYFTKTVYNQNLKDYSFQNEQFINLEFNEEINDTNLKIELLYPPYDSIWYLQEMDKSNKKLTLWMFDTLITKSDSISIGLQYPVPDSNEILVTKYDTIEFMQRQVKNGQGKKKLNDDGKRLGFLKHKQEADTTAKDTVVIPKIKTTHTAKLSGHDLNKPILINSATPILNYSADSFRLIYYDDTIPKTANYAVMRDTTTLRSLIIDCKWEENTNYQLLIPEGNISDIYGAINDTIKIKFITQKADHYGVMNLNLKGVNDFTIVEFLDTKEKILETFYTVNDTIISIEYIEPGAYLLKAIVDVNRNKKWDSGDYDKKRQPETVIYYNGEANIRSNWELELYWDLNDRVRVVQDEK